MQGRNRGAPGTKFPNVILRRTDEVIETIRAIQLPANAPFLPFVCTRCRKASDRSRCGVARSRITKLAG